MEQLITQLRGALTGTITTSAQARNAVRHDGSLFEIIPDAVFTPASSQDVKTLVRFITTHKSQFPKLAITPRGAGTDMSGAAIGSSIILDTQHLNALHGFRGHLVQAQPGVKLYDLQRMLSAHSLTIGSSPSSEDIATVGGMVANNAAGAASFRHGSTQAAVRSLKVVLADGNEYTVRALSQGELAKKMAETTYEGRLYAHLYSLLNRHYDLIRNARPYSTKNASGYNLWDVWDKEAGVFDMTQLITGSQGTLGVITDVTLEAVRQSAYTGTLLVQLPTLRNLDAILKLVKQHRPLSIEGFDDISFAQGVRSRKVLRKQLGTREYTKQQLQLNTAPHLTLAITLDAETQKELTQKLEQLHGEIGHYRVAIDILTDDSIDGPLRRTRNATLALLQDQIKTRHASPFIDDMAVHPQYISAFLPRLRKLLKKHKLPATIHGHFGDGNFHILPLITLSANQKQSILEPLMRDITSLVLEYGGTISAEHGDGMVRGPWLPAQYGQEVYGLFKAVKELFDPLYIFNPHKKTDASWEYSMSHLRLR